MAVPIGKLMAGVKEATVKLVALKAARAVKVTVVGLVPLYPSVSVAPLARAAGSALIDKDVIADVPVAALNFELAPLGLTTT